MVLLRWSDQNSSPGNRELLNQARKISNIGRELLNQARKLLNQGREISKQVRELSNQARELLNQGFGNQKGAAGGLFGLFWCPNLIS